MPSVVLEFAIMLPLVFLVSAVLIFTTNYIADSWTTIRIQSALSITDLHLASTIRQLYYSFNDSSVSAGTITKTSDLPTTIELYPYTAVGSISSVSGTGSVKNLLLTLHLTGKSISAVTTVTLGVNVNWISTTLTSNSQTAAIQLQKFANGTVTISFR